MDFVPNHTSDEHEWFGKSQNRVESFEDYYIWKDGKAQTKSKSDEDLQLPNNWVYSVL